MSEVVSAKTDPAWSQNAGQSDCIAALEVEAALGRIARSAAFRHVERPTRFIRYLVEMTVSGRAHLLKESRLAAEIFGRDETWDSRVDPVVRQEAGRLRKRLARYYEAEGSSDPVRIELPVGAYVPEIRLIAVPAPLQIAPRIHAVPDWFRTRSIGAFFLALFVTGGFVAYRLHASKPAPSIAVLPFASLSADPANQYFSDGLTDEITDRLSHVKGLRVIAAASAFQSRGHELNIGEIGRELHVSNVLQGSVQRSGNQLKIIAQLENASDGTNVWSNTYERSATDLFAVQSELAAGIVASLKVTSKIQPATHVPSPEAHEYLLKGRYALQQSTTESVEQAEVDFERAIDLDPQYALAYSELAIAKCNLGVARGSAYKLEEEGETAQQLFRKALVLDPDLPAAHAGLAGIRLQYNWDWKGAEQELKSALAGPPNASVEKDYAFLLIFRGRFAEADEHLRRMQDLDPFSTASMLNLALARNLEGRFAECGEISENVSAHYPKILNATILSAQADIERGRIAPALAKIRLLKEQGFPGAPIYEAMARARAGERDQALRLIRPLEQQYPNGSFAMQWLALVYALLGDKSATLTWLERSADRHEFQLLNLAVHPLYAPVRDSPRFHALEKRIGLE